jgi:pyrroloquinoline quinone biosynthesis protein E
VAELTYRCPLRCAYCSNPRNYRDVRESLDAATWTRAFHEAAQLGVVHAGLSGGEPSARRDLREIVAGADAAGLYVHLVTAGTTLDADALARLRDAGLASVQLSLQDSDASEGDAVAGVACAERKLVFAAAVRELGLSLVLNVVLHRRNLQRVPAIIELARKLGATRLELANAQYYGWALANRDALLPSREQVASAARAVESARRLPGGPEILFVLPDYLAGRPKPCMGGWGRRTIVVAPDGLVLPCHAARELPDLEFGSLLRHPLAWCWRDAPGMNAFRGEAWMKEPCRSCPERTRDFGGCRCQAHLLSGDSSATDPACELSPHHGTVRAAREAAERARGDDPRGATRLHHRGEWLPEAS